jgi:hypothetical protein
MGGGGRAQLFSTRNATRGTKTNHYRSLPRTEMQSAPKCEVDSFQVLDLAKMGSANKGWLRPLSAASNRMPSMGRSTPWPFCGKQSPQRNTQGHMQHASCTPSAEHKHDKPQNRKGLMGLPGR